MTKIAGMMLLLLGVAGLANASGVVSAPEIDPASGVSALALLSGALLIIRSRLRKS